MSEWGWILVAALAGGLALRVWDRRRARTRPPTVDLGSDVAIAAVLGLAAWVYYDRIHEAVNSLWLPFGQDNHEYLECALAARWMERDHWVGARYPLYAALSASWSVLSGTPLWRATMQVALASSVALPMAVYAFGRVYTTRPLAFAGALLIIPIRAHLSMLATPNDYPLATVLYLLSTAALVGMIREGGVARHLTAGALVAAYFFTTPKAFPLTMMGIAAIFLVQIVDRKLDLRSLVVFLLPIGLVWAAFGALKLPLYPLENSVFLAQTTSPVAILDPNAVFPDVGWTPDQHAMERGYWVPGTWRAIVHLPDTLQYLLFAPVRRLSLDALPEAYLFPIARLCGFPELPALVALAVLGTLGAWKAGPKVGRGMLVVGFAFAVAAVHLWGLTSADYADRWAFPIIHSTPVLLLAAVGLVAGRRARPALVEWGAWTPLLAAVVWTLGYSRSYIGTAEVATWAAGWQWERVTKLRAFLPLYEAVRPGDAVVDATENALGRTLLDGLGVHVVEAETSGIPGAEQIGLRTSGVDAPRRWIILECVSREELPLQGVYSDAFTAINADTTRYRKLSRCIYEDLQPTEPLFLPAAAASMPGSRAPGPAAPPPPPLPAGASHP